MMRGKILALFVFASTLPVSAEACRLYRPFTPGDARLADVVVVGRIRHYYWTVDRTYLRGGYADFDIAVAETLKGKAGATLHAQSSYRMPENTPGAFAIGLYRHGGGAMGVLDNPCGGPFVALADAPEAKAVRWALNATYPAPMTTILPPPEMTEADFAAWPGIETVTALYPEAAQKGEIEGMVKLDCVSDTGGRLTCRSKDEAPQHYGFGGAAVKLFERTARLKPGRVKPGSHVRVSWRWRLE